MNDTAHSDDHAGKAASAGRPVTSRLHRDVYLTAAALAIWLLLSVWLFAGAGVTNYLLLIISGFIFVVVALISILSRVGGWRRGPKPISRHCANGRIPILKSARVAIDPG